MFTISGVLVGVGGLTVRAEIKNDEYLNGEFIKLVQDRGAAIIAARKLSSAASAANATVDHMHDWLLGTPQGEVVSMAVCSDGSYGVPKGLIYSYEKKEFFLHPSDPNPMR